MPSAFTGIKGITTKLSAEQLAELHQHPQVKSIETNRVLRHPSQAVNNTKAYIDAWGVDRLDQTALPLDGDYSPAGDGHGVHAYIIDSGIRLSHYEFAGRAQWDFTASTIIEGNDDLNGHGTHLAG